MSATIYLYCYNCIWSSFGNSKDGLTHQRDIKHQEWKQPDVQMTKQYIKEQHLGEFVIMPTESDLSFKKWWRTLEKY